MTRVPRCVTMPTPLDHRSCGWVARISFLQCYSLCGFRIAPVDTEGAAHGVTVWRMTSVKDFPTSPSQIRQTLRGCEVGNTDPGMSLSPETLGEFSSAGGLLLAALAGGDQDHPVVRPGQNCTGSVYICRYGPGQGSLIWCRCFLYSSLSGCCVLDYGNDGVFVHTPRPRRILACSRRRHPQHRRYRNVQRY